MTNKVVKCTFPVIEVKTIVYYINIFMSLPFNSWLIKRHRSTILVYQFKIDKTSNPHPHLSKISSNLYLTIPIFVLKMLKWMWEGHYLVRIRSICTLVFSHNFKKMQKRIYHFVMIIDCRELNISSGILSSMNSDQQHFLILKALDYHNVMYHNFHLNKMIHTWQRMEQCEQYWANNDTSVLLVAPSWS
jgi:hypothetical protein